MRSFPVILQHDTMNCGPACLQMIAKFYGKSISQQKLRQLSETTRAGSSLLGLSRASEQIGFRTIGVKIDLKSLISDSPYPCICFWNKKHFVVVYKFKNNKVYVVDPAHGKLTYSISEFLNGWIGSGANIDTTEGIALLLTPTPDFNELEEEPSPKSKGFKFLFKYLKEYRKLIVQLGLGLLAISILQLIFPFLTQSIVDIAIQNKDLHFLYLVLIGQLFIFVGKTVIEITRSWILLHLSARINISLVSDFLIKLMKLPIAFFDVKLTGDIMQRMGDHQRIESLLTNQTLGVFFSAFNFIVFGCVLAFYSVPVFLIFLLGTIIYFLWVSMFMKRRKDLDHKRFSQMSDEKSKVMELITGMQEIKLHNAEHQRRWRWEQLQIRLFKLQIQSLRLEQIQSNGSLFLNELKNIVISFYTAKLVIEGQLTLGMMLSVSYIIGQLNSPISQFLSFAYSVQDARISLERLNEIHEKENEESESNELINELPTEKDLKFEDVTFRYSGSEIPVLQNIDLTIPTNKITAIVGASGSGKTTLMKLLLRFYEPNSGKIKIGGNELKNYTHYIWRENSGSVMQDGIIFNDTIANNIAFGAESIEYSKLDLAAHIANISEFIQNLPMGYNTPIGGEGIGISGGQKQRILIARAIYKNPSFLFFDEATSSLDTSNESIIVSNLNEYFKGRTAVIIAHRLSTVKNADQIVVLDSGKIIEKGTHEDLLKIKGTYFNLVKDQLDLERTKDY